MEVGNDSRSQTTRDRMNTRPHLKVGITMADVEKFKEIDQTKYKVTKRPRVVKANVIRY